MGNGKKKVFITGGTGYIGSHVIPRLLQRGHDVKALVRRGSERRLARGVTPTVGDALVEDSYAAEVAGCDTFIRLVGVAHPSPTKGAAFRSIDYVAGQIATRVAKKAAITHFIYLSVAHPAPIMRDYIAVRVECEKIIRSTGISATFVRPWYVLGPGHRWPSFLLPFYWIADLFPQWREPAQRLGLVKLPQILDAIVCAVETPPIGVQILDVPAIRAAHRSP